MANFGRKIGDMVRPYVTSPLDEENFLRQLIPGAAKGYSDVMQKVDPVGNIGGFLSSLVGNSESAETGPLSPDTTTDVPSVPSNQMDIAEMDDLIKRFEKTKTSKSEGFSMPAMPKRNPGYESRMKELEAKLDKQEGVETAARERTRKGDILGRILSMGMRSPTMSEIATKTTPVDVGTDIKQSFVTPSMLDEQGAQSGYQKTLDRYKAIMGAEKEERDLQKDIYLTGLKQKGAMDVAKVRSSGVKDMTMEEKLRYTKPSALRAKQIREEESGIFTSKGTAEKNAQQRILEEQEADLSKLNILMGGDQRLNKIKKGLEYIRNNPDDPQAPEALEGIKEAMQDMVANG